MTSERDRDFNKNPANDNGTPDGDGDGKADRDLNAGGPETQNTHNTRANDSHGPGEAQEPVAANAATRQVASNEHSELGTHDADNVSGDMAIGHPKGDDPTDPPAGAKNVLPGRMNQAEGASAEPREYQDGADIVDNPPTAPIDVSRSKR